MGQAHRLALAVQVVAFASVASAQEIAMDAGRLAHALDRLANTGRVLYIAAHPDDENTRLLAYLANARHLTVTYLSITRGGGGQNLIGPEQDELLGIIRTEELLAARRLDGARQRFTRMIDFGYSKSAEETLRIWGHDEALADVVWAIRSFRPDVIIARFNELPPNHGHHTASAILAREAFVAAADRRRFPEHIEAGVEAWQADRLLLNVPMWRDTTPPRDALVLDVGAYDARLGIGYGDLAAASRSQHKSQGFGRAGERGPLLEYFTPLAGNRPATDILEGLRFDWGRYGEMAVPVDRALGEARRLLERDSPERAVPALLAARTALATLPKVPHTREALAHVDDVIAAASGLFVRATAARPGAVPGSTVRINLEVSLRRPVQMKLERVIFPDAEATDIAAALDVGGRREVAREVMIPADFPVSTPYWLAQPGVAGRYEVADRALIGQPKDPQPLSVALEVTIDGQTLRLDAPVVYAWTHRVHGERTRRFLIVPPATVSPVRRAVMLTNGGAGRVDLRIRAGADEVKGDVVLPVPAGWSVEPEKIPFDIARAGDETTVRFAVRHPKDAAPAEVRPAVVVAGKTWSLREDVIDYPHIPMQIVLQPAQLRVLPLEIQVAPGKVGYIAGSGDSVADDLAHIGVEVNQLDDETLRSGDLSGYAAIVVGVRAYNTRAALRGGAHERLMRYAEQGGTVVVQYNTSSEWEPLTVAIGPYPFVVGRGRVTDESAAMSPVDDGNILLQRPNRIVSADFDGWVQERGLYFAESWDDRYRPIFRVADPQEQPQLGAVLVASHGRGRYVYTGLAFFRQLPAGVPGAYRLLANLIARPQP
jgi:LmbE family N-acetylglucosaminyl deacetylase